MQTQTYTCSFCFITDGKVLNKLGAIICMHSSEGMEFILRVKRSLCPTACTPIVIQLCLRSRIGWWENITTHLFDITHCFSSDVGFTNIVVRSTRQVGIDGGWCHLVEDNAYIYAQTLNEHFSTFPTFIPCVRMLNIMFCPLVRILLPTFMK